MEGSQIKKVFLTIIYKIYNKAADELKLNYSTAKAILHLHRKKLFKDYSSTERCLMPCKYAKISDRSDQ